MSQSFTPRQESHPAGPDHVVLWVVLLGVAFWPRLWIIAFWIFGRQLGEAFSAWIVPALGFLVAPWTTVLYAFMWSIDSDGVHGWEWSLVGAALLLDVWFWAAGARSLRQ